MSSLSRITAPVVEGSSANPMGVSRLLILPPKEAKYGDVSTMEYFYSNLRLLLHLVMPLRCNYSSLPLLGRPTLTECKKGQREREPVNGARISSEASPVLFVRYYDHATEGSGKVVPISCFF